MGESQVDCVSDPEQCYAGGYQRDPPGNLARRGAVRSYVHVLRASVAWAAAITGPEQTDVGWLLVSLHSAAVK